MPQIPNIDQYIVGFVTTNPYTIILGLAMLKGIAKLTPGTTDDKISTLLSSMFGTINPLKKKKNSMNINIDGDFMGDEAYVDKLAKKINESIEPSEPVKP
jgi:hypothetical protein